jgi:hypothetical protein
MKNRTVNIENSTPRTNVFFQAHAIKSANPNLTFGTSLVKAWELYRLRKRMGNEIVEFVYKKSDGTIRIANGTLNQYIAETKGTSTRKSYKQFNTMPYFDVEAKGWRAFKVSGLLNIF